MSENAIEAAKPSFFIPLVLVAAIILLPVFLAAYYFIRKSLQPTENFDPKMLGSL